MGRPVSLAIALLVSLAACDPAPGADAGARDSGADSGGAPCVGPPGLYSDDACQVLAENTLSYHPRFALWSDGADKDRFVFLPPGTQIDTTDPDNWLFPVGTRIYKTFLIDGVRLETRLLEKTDPGMGRLVWDMRVFAWNGEQNAVTEVTDTGGQNVLGTEHDVPTGVDCQQCHWGVGDVINSFSAIQLNHNEDGVTLAMLNSEGWLTSPIDTAAADVPGNTTEAAALGYLHANCGNCHRETPGAATGCATPACSTGLRMWINVADATVADTQTWMTGVGVPHRPTECDIGDPDSICAIEPMDSTHSTILVRMGARGTCAQMPPLASEVPHPDGMSAVSLWIGQIVADGSACVP